MERRKFLEGLGSAALVRTGTAPSQPGWPPRAADDERVYDVRQHGARGDGRTDDTVALQQVIERGGGDGVICFPPGDYIISRPLALPANACWHLRGAGRSLSRIRAATSAPTGECLRSAHGHRRPEFGCVLEDLRVDAGGRPGSAITLVGQTLLGMRRITVADAKQGSGLVLIGLFDSYFEDVYVEDCGDPDHPAVLCRSPATAGGDSINNCVFVDLHVEGRIDAVHVDIDGTRQNPADTLQFHGLKCHGEPVTGNPARPLLRLGQHAIGCTVFGGLVAFGRGEAQVDVDGQRNRFVGIDHGCGSPRGNPSVGYRLRKHAVGNQIASPNFKNGVGEGMYGSGYVRVDRGANGNHFVFPRMSTGPLPIARVLSDEGRGTLFLGDDLDDNHGLLVRHGLGFTPLRTNGISGTDVPARNLRGRVVLDGNAWLSEVRFPAAEQDGEYHLACTVADVQGSPAPGATRVHATAKRAGGFTLRLEAAPGPGNTVTVDWILVR